MTQRALSERLAAHGRPMAVTAISRTEYRQRRVDVDDLIALAAALGVSPTALLLPARADG
jgi:transcriptional regulator with XRE-family HTH domain